MNKITGVLQDQNKVFTKKELGDMVLRQSDEINIEILGDKGNKILRRLFFRPVIGTVIYTTSEDGVISIEVNYDYIVRLTSLPVMVLFSLGLTMIDLVKDQWVECLEYVEEFKSMKDIEFKEIFR